MPWRTLLKFATVGAIALAVDTVVFVAAKSTILEPKPVAAKICAVSVATIVSYVLNRQWSFRTRSVHRPAREALLYFLISGAAVVITAAPLVLSRYVFDLVTPHVSSLTMHVADLVSAQVIGTSLAMVLRWWAFRRWVFPTAPTVATSHGGTAAHRRRLEFRGRRAGSGAPRGILPIRGRERVTGQVAAGELAD